jgi:hypothetical protein
MRAAVVELAEKSGVDPDELVEWWAERAAIREIDGGQSREDAERGALDDMREVIELGAWMLGTGRKGPKPASSTAVDRSRTAGSRRD